MKKISIVFLLFFVCIMVYGQKKIKLVSGGTLRWSDQATWDGGNIAQSGEDVSLAFVPHGLGVSKSTLEVDVPIDVPNFNASFLGPPAGGLLGESVLINLGKAGEILHYSIGISKVLKNPLPSNITNPNNRLRLRCDKYPADITFYDCENKNFDARLVKANSVTLNNFDLGLFKTFASSNKKTVLKGTLTIEGIADFRCGGELDAEGQTIIIDNGVLSLDGSTIYGGGFTNPADYIITSLVVSKLEIKSTSGKSEFHFTGRVDIGEMIVDAQDANLKKTWALAPYTISVGKFSGANPVGVNPQLDQIELGTDGETIVVPFDGTPCKPNGKEHEFVVLVNGNRVAVDNITLDGDKYKLKMSRIIGKDEVITIKYLGGILTDASQKPIANIPEGTEVKNNSNKVLPILKVDTLTIWDNMQKLKLVFSQEMKASSTINWADFKIKAGGVTETLTSSTTTLPRSFTMIEFEIGTINIPWLIQHKDNLKLSYEGNWLENTTLSHIKLAHFSGKKVELIDNMTNVIPTNAVISENGTKIQVNFNGDGLKHSQPLDHDCFELKLEKTGESIKTITISTVYADNSGNLLFTLSSGNAIPKDTLIESLTLTYDPAISGCEILSTKGVKIEGFTIGTGGTVTFHNNSKVGDIFYVNNTAKITFDGKYVLLTCDEPVKVQEDYKNNKDNWFLVSKKSGSNKSYVKVVAITLHPYDNKTVVLHLERSVPESEGDLYLAPYTKRRADGPIVSASGNDQLHPWTNWILLERGEGVNPPAVPLSPIGIVSIFGLIALIGFIRYRR